MTRKSSASRSPAATQLFDELLVVMAQQGDREALHRLYERWNARLMRAARRYCGTGDVVDDLAQECWLAICARLHSLRDPARFRSFAFAILHRKGADRLRRSYREGDVAVEPPDQAIPATQDEGLAITQAFAALPPDQRFAAHLNFVEGLTLPEIAAVQSIPEGTAKSRLFHARRKLKAALSEPSERTEGDLT